MRKLYLLFFVFIIGIFPAKSQSGASEFFSVLSGLPHSDVKHLFFDPEGFLWIGTSNGLSRYDGYAFTNFTTNTAALNHLQSDYVFSIDNAGEGQLVFLTRKGFELYRKNNQSFTYFSDTTIGAYVNQVCYNDITGNVYYSNGEVIGFFNTLAEVPASTLSLIAKASIKDQVKIKSSGSYLWIFYNNTVVKYNTVTSQGKSLDDHKQFQVPNAIQDVISFDNEILAVLSYPNIHLLRKEDLKVLKTIKTPLGTLENLDKDFYKLVRKGASELLLYNHSSAYHVDIITGKNTVFYKTERTGEYINTIITDNSGVIWIGTTKGLHKVILTEQPIQHIEYDKNWLNSNHLIKYKTPGGSNIALTKEKCLVELPPDLLDSKEAAKAKCICKTGIDNAIILISENATINIIKGTKNTIISHPQLENTTINHVGFSSWDSILYLATNKGLVVSKISDFSNPNLRIDKIIADTNSFVKVLVNRKGAYAQTQKSIFKAYVKRDSIIDMGKPKEASNINDFYVQENGNLWLVTDKGLYFTTGEKTTYEKQSLFLGDIPINNIVADNLGELWLSSPKGLIRYSPTKRKQYWFNSSDGVPNISFKNTSAQRLVNGELIFGVSNGFLIVAPEKIFINNNPCQIHFVKGVLFQQGNSTTVPLKNEDTLLLQSHVKNSEIIFSALDFYAPQFNTYEYILNAWGKPNSWTSIEHQNSIIISNLASGTYELRVRGRNNHGELTENEAVLFLKVQASIWRTKIALVIYLALFVLIIYVIVNARTRQLQRSNKEFREKERIAEKVKLQKEELTLKNKSITDSINYARRIQMGMMPSLKTFKGYFSESFILYLPKDIVSGDFYWINEVDGKIFFSAVDCTGHGVPGAFMSIIGFELFRRITEADKNLKPALILDQLSDNLQNFFTDENEGPLHDGMDLAFCSIDKKMKKLEYSGAFNPLYIVRDNSIIEYKANRFSVGWNGEGIETEKFKNHEIDLLPGDVIYIFTDGYADQFGGPDGKKYKYRRFRHLLLALHQLSLDRQEEFLRKSIMEWKGDNEQVDDILVIGIRIPSI